MTPLYQGIVITGRRKSHGCLASGLIFFGFFLTLGIIDETIDATSITFLLLGLISIVSGIYTLIQARRSPLPTILITPRYIHAPLAIPEGQGWHRSSLPKVRYRIMREWIGQWEVKKLIDGKKYFVAPVNEKIHPEIPVVDIDGTVMVLIDAQQFNTDEVLSRLNNHPVLNPLPAIYESLGEPIPEFHPGIYVSPQAAEIDNHSPAIFPFLTLKLIIMSLICLWTCCFLFTCLDDEMSDFYRIALWVSLPVIAFAFVALLVKAFKLHKINVTLTDKSITAPWMIMTFDGKEKPLSEQNKGFVTIDYDAIMPLEVFSNRLNKRLLTRFIDPENNLLPEGETQFLSLDIDNLKDSERLFVTINTMIERQKRQSKQ